ncbi:cell surface glycoprotein 1-like isoform X2 [Branchiostoma lanceolatum]|uniref:cell surface glycoprotein 1-like isoform X2 n=1 Tax=Branchiostoma lanceolatum TaxID=7740 RepID=UPI0034547AAC
MSAEGAVETKTEGEEAVAEAGAEAGAEAEAEVLVVTEGGVDDTDAGNSQDVKRKKFRPLKSIRKILGIKKGRKKSGEDPALLSAKPVSKSTGALLQVVETEQEEDVSNKTLANRSMSADSVFSPANAPTEPLRKGDMAASADNLSSQNFQSELSAKLKSRRSEDGASSEDECLPRSPDTIVTMADVINEHSTQNGMKRHSEESLESVGDEPGIAMTPDQLGQGEKHQARQGTSVPADFGSTGDVDLDAIPASPTHLSNQAALHKLSIAPKLRKASSRTRGVGKSPSTTPDLPIMSENHRTDDSPEPMVTPADSEPPPKPPRTGTYRSPRTSVSQDVAESSDPPAPATETVDISITVADTGDTPTALAPETGDTPASEAPVSGTGDTPTAVAPETGDTPASEAPVSGTGDTPTAVAPGKITGHTPVLESLGTETGDMPKAEAPDATPADAPASETPGTAAGDTSTAAVLGNEMADTPADSADISIVEAGGTETAIATAPGTETAIAVAPGTETAVATSPDTETAVATPPGTETAVATPPGTETAVATPPGTETAVAIAPGTETAPAPVATDHGTETADPPTDVAPDNHTADIQITAGADVAASDMPTAEAPHTDSEANFTSTADHLQEPSDLVGQETESDEVVNTAAAENEVIPPDATSDAVPPDNAADTAEPVPTQSAQYAFVPTLTPTREEGPLLEEQVVEFCPPVEVDVSVEMPVVASQEEPVVNTDASSVEVDEDSLGKFPTEEPVQNDEGVMEDGAGGEEEEEVGDSGASSSGAAGSADQATDEDTGEAIAQRLLAVVAQQERTGGGEEPTAGSPPPSDLPDQPTPASPEPEDQEPADDTTLITPKSPTRGPPNPLGMQLVEEMKRKQSVKKQDSFDEEEPPPEEPEESGQVEETAAAEPEVPPAEEQDPPVAAPDPETTQQEEQHGMYEDSHDSLQEDSHGAVQHAEEEEAEEKVEDEPKDDLAETHQETASSEDEAPPAEEEPPEEEEPEKETEKQNGPVEDETTPSEEEQEEERQIVAEPQDEPVRPKRLSVAETRQMFARSEPPTPETETVIRPKLKPVPPKVEPSPSSSQPTKPVPIEPKETIVVKKASTPVVPSPMSPTTNAAPQLRSLAEKPQPKKVFGAIKALEDQGDDKVPAWVRIAQKKQKEREGKDEDDTIGGKKVVVVEKTPPATSSTQSAPKSPVRKPSTGAVPPKVLVVEKTGSVTARPSAPRPSVSPAKPFSRPAEPPSPVIIPATKSQEQPKPLKSPTKPAESKPAVSTSPPPAKSADLMANNNKLNRAGQFLTRQQKKNFILPKPEKCIVCKENVYQTEMVKSDGRFFHKKCQRCLVCKRTLDISSFMVIQEKIYCKQHGQEVKLAQQAV